jgi:hypothetical protein
LLFLNKKNLGPKNGLERRVWQFYTICDKISFEKQKADKVTTILVFRSATGQLHATSGSAQKFVWGSMVRFQKTSCNFSPTPTHTVIRQDFVELGAFELISAFDS